MPGPGLDDAGSCVGDVVTASSSEDMQMSQLLADADTSADATVLIEAECYAMLEKLMNRVRDDMSGLMTCLERVEVSTKLRGF